MALGYVFLITSGDAKHPEIAKEVIGQHKIIGDLTDNTFETRFKNFKTALSLNPKYIWSVRGGFGASSTLYLLEKHGIRPSQDSAYVGFSDSTFLLMWFRTHQKLAIHGPQPHANTVIYKKTGYKPNRKVKFSFDPIKKRIYGFETLHNPKKLKTLKGAMIGGNLTCIHDQLGSKTQLQGNNQVVFLEETNEKSGNQEKLIQALIDAKTFEGAKAVFLGDMNEPKHMALMIHRRYPHLLIVYSPKFGHADYNGFLPFGFEMNMDLETQKFYFDNQKHLPYEPVVFDRPHRVMRGELDMVSLISLNGQYKVRLKSDVVLTLQNPDYRPRIIRNIVSLLRAGTLKENTTVSIKKDVVIEYPDSDEDKRLIAQELWRLCKLRIVWV
ncbi:MAG: LD-carboxypeptidase [Alphaproteobacteria bacterium]|nr:MAG: LD-carboxypeptidase [Alphaproteobacteria bacterium]